MLRYSASLCRNPEDLLGQFLEVDGLQAHVDVAGEAEQPFGDGPAPFHRGDDGVDVADEPGVVLVGLREGEDVLHQPGLFVDDGQGVVDLMGHARGQASDGGHAVGVLDVVQGVGPGLVRDVDLAHHVGGRPDDGQEDQRDVGQKDPEQFAPRVLEGLHHIGRELHHDEDEGACP